MGMLISAASARWSFLKLLAFEMEFLLVRQQNRPRPTPTAATMPGKEFQNLGLQFMLRYKKNSLYRRSFAFFSSH